MQARPGQKRKWAEQRQDISPKKLLEPKPKGLFHQHLPTRVDKILELSKPPLYFHFIFSMCECPENTHCWLCEGRGREGEEKAF